MAAQRLNLFPCSGGGWKVLKVMLNFVAVAQPYGLHLYLQMEKSNLTQDLIKYMQHLPICIKSDKKSNFLKCLIKWHNKIYVRSFKNPIVWLDLRSEEVGFFVRFDAYWKMLHVFDKILCPIWFLHLRRMNLSREGRLKNSENNPSQLFLTKSVRNDRHIYKSVVSLWRESLGTYQQMNKSSANLFQLCQESRLDFLVHSTSDISKKPRTKWRNLRKKLLWLAVKSVGSCLSPQPTTLTCSCLCLLSLRIWQQVTKVFYENFFISSLVSSIYPKWSVPRNQAWFPDITGTDSLKICSFVDNCRGIPVKDSPRIFKCVCHSPGILLGKID